MFGYFFYWTIHSDFPPQGAGLSGPGAQWPTTAFALMLVGWVLTIAARELNTRYRFHATRAALAVAAVSTGAGGVAGLAGPWLHGLDPTLHVYPAIVWVIAIWMAAHALVGVVMQLYVIARSTVGRMTAIYDGDVRNVVVYQHFLAFGALIAFATLGWFPRLA